MHWWLPADRAPARHSSRWRCATWAAPATAPPGAGALAAIDAPFLWFAVGIAPAPEALEAAERHLDRLARALTPWDAGRSYWNFAERKVDPASLVGSDAYRRLQEVRRRVDPDGRFLANHVVEAAGG
jgi:hypothetical protein